MPANTITVFSVATYRNDLILEGGHRKNTDLQNVSVPFPFFFSHSALPTKMTEICSFLYYCGPIAVVGLKTWKREIMMCTGYDIWTV